MGFGKCCCCIFCLVTFAGVFVAIFFISVSASVKLTKVHHILEDVVVSNLSLSKADPGVIDSASMTFKVWSRNANKKMGVRIWHMRIAVTYNGHELGRAYVFPAFVQPPRNITRLEAPLLISNFTMPSSEAASRLQTDVESGVIPLKIYVRIRGKYKRVGGSWETKLISGELHGDDKCNLRVNLAKSNGTESSLEGRQCGWTVDYYNPDA